MNNISSKLNKIIELYSYTESISDEGVKELDYSFYKSVFAGIKPIGVGKDIFIAMQLANQEYYIFSIRHEDHIIPQMKIKYQNQFFIIKRVIEEDNLLKLITLKECHI